MARDDAVTLDVVVHARAGREKLGPVMLGRLKVAVTAPPVDGQANAAVCLLLARALDVPKSAVTVIRGETSTKKTLAVRGVTRAAIDALLRASSPTAP